jgi:hypothetical protein
VATPGILAITPVLLADEMGPPAPPPTDADDVIHPAFPAQDPALVREMVGVSHFSLERVRGLLEQQPELAKAAWDWGFGDWESALGAASHTGNREIALLLIEHGARIDIFAAAMLGHTDVVRALIEASPGIQRTPGPHGLTLLHHARAGGERAQETLAYLHSIQGADDAPERAPLAEVDRATYLGAYRFAPGDRGVLEIGYSERFDMLTISRAGGTARNLVHHGAHTFSPVGAPHVRIAFSIPRSDGARLASSLSITAPRPLISATRAC